MKLFSLVILSQRAAYAQRVFSGITTGIPSSAAAAIKSDIDTYFDQVVTEPSWDSATSAMTQVPAIASQYNTNPLLLAVEMFTAVSTPTWFSALPGGLQTYVYSVASVQASFFNKEVYTTTSADTRTLPTSAASSSADVSSIASSSATDSFQTPTLSTVPQNAPTNGAGQTNMNQQGQDGLSIGAKVGIGIGVGVGGAVILAGLGVLLWWILRRRRRTLTEKGSETGVYVHEEPGVAVN